LETDVIHEDKKSGYAQRKIMKNGIIVFQRNIMKNGTIVS
jgi:hypothetical protein